MSTLADERYTVAKEFCGYPQARWVARWCGDWLGQGKTKSDATLICIAHADKRDRELKGVL